MANSSENSIKCLKHRGHYNVELREVTVGHSRTGQQMKLMPMFKHIFFKFFCKYL